MPKTKDAILVGVVGTKASTTEDGRTDLTGGVSTMLKDSALTDGVAGVMMGRADSTTKEGFVAGVVGMKASSTEVGRSILTRGDSTKLKELGSTGGVKSSVMGRVDGWMGVRERFWPACACRATSEIARPVGMGGLRAEIDSGTGPVADRGRCGDLAIRPVGIGKCPVPSCCRRGLATRALVVEDSASSNRPSKKASKSFIMGESNRMEAEIVFGS